MRFTIKAKLAATFAVVVALSAGGMFIAIQNLATLDASFTAAMDGNVKRISLADDINARTLRVARDEKNVMLATTIEEMDQFGAAIATEAAAIHEDLAHLRELSSEQGRIRVDAFAKEWDEFLAVHAKVMEYAHLNSDVRARTLAQTDGAAGFDAIVEPLDRLVDEIAADPMPDTADVALLREIAHYREDLFNIRYDALDIIASSDDPAEQAKFSAELDTYVADLETVSENLSRKLAGGQKAAFESVREKVAGWLETVTAYRAISLENGTDKAHELAVGEGEAARAEAVAAINAIIDLNNEQLAAAQVANGALYEGSRNLLIGLLVGSTLIAALAATWIVMGISRGLGRVKQVVSAVAVGDLDQRIEIKTNDEIKDLVDTVNVMTTNLRTTAALADEIAGGNLTVQPNPLSDKDTLGISLKTMVEKLRDVIADAIASASNVSAGSQ